MRRVLFNILLLILISSSCIIPQQFSTGSPEWLVDMFFRQSSFVDKSYYYTGEMISDVDKPTIGEELIGKGEALFHQIKATNNECVFTAELNVDDKIIDFYCSLIKQEEGEAFKMKVFASGILTEQAMPAMIQSVPVHLLKGIDHAKLVQQLCGILMLKRTLRQVQHGSVSVL